MQNILRRERSIGKQLTPRVMIAFSLPAFISAVMHGPAAMILPGFMATQYGIELAVVGHVLLISRLFDAVTDPVIGYLSDHTRSRFGRRKPWVVSGYAIALSGLFFLYAPVGQPTGLYFAIWFMVLYLGWTMAEIPIGAWALELHRASGQRARLAGYRAWFMAVGTIAYSFTPLLPIFATTSFSPESLEFMAWGCVLIMPVLVAWQVWVVPTGKKIGVAASASVIRLLRLVWGNKPFLWYLLAHITTLIVASMQTAGFFIWVKVYLQMGDKMPYLLGFATFALLLMTPVAIFLVRRIGHLKALIVVNIFSQSAVLAGFFLKPGPWAFPLVMLGLAFVFAANAVKLVAYPTWIGDITDYGILKSGEDDSAQYVSLSVLSEKMFYAVGGAAVFYVMAIFGVDAQATSLTQQESFGVRFAVNLLPAVVGLFSLLFYIYFPLKPHHGVIIRKRLNQRMERVVRDKKTDEI